MSDDIVQYSWHKPSVCVVDFRYFYYTKRNEFMLFLFRGFIFISRVTNKDKSAGYQL